jgi:3-deoxy-D-manno-octulosonic-acid transferase
LGRVPRSPAQTPLTQRWILGSFWDADLALFDDSTVLAGIANGTLMIMAVPHLLDSQWATRLRARGVVVHEITLDTRQLPSGPGVWLIGLKGLLCELYAHAGRAYVGGGFGRSIHSVLEPFVAGAHVVVGPRVHRSTELELVQAVEPTSLTVCLGTAQLARALEKSDALSKDTRARWAHNQRVQARELLDAVGGEGC